MKRRTVLKALAGGCMLASNLSAKSARQKFKMGKRGALKKLVVVFQRGGNDGLNAMIPVDPVEYGLYQGLRPSLQIPQGSILAIPGNSFFGLHPAMGSLLPMIQAGNCSLIHAVGYPNSDRSHFESQSYFETAVPGNSLMDGWLNRLLANTTGPGLIRGISVGSNIPQSVTGSVAIPVSNNFGLSNVSVDEYLEPPADDDYRQSVQDLYSLSATAGNEAIYDTGTKIFQMIENFSTRDLDNYTPENGATYPSTNLGNRVRHAAQMLKETPNFIGVEVVTIDQGGYDTHANQLTPGNPTDPNSRHASLLQELSNSMAAFYTDMGPARMDDTLFLVISEFGRRAYQNSSNGTDHGTGSLAIAMGNAVNGNIINGGGSWPGLNNLLWDDDLDWVTDFRDIYWEILANHMGIDGTTLQTIVPGHTHTPVGFVS